MSPEVFQVVLVLGGAVAGWLARHFNVVGPSTPATPAAPSAPSAPTGIGHGQVLAWLFQQAQVDFPAFLQALAQASQTKQAPKS